MNNRYLFRGKRKDNGEWIIGYYVFQRKRSGVFGQVLSKIDYNAHLIVDVWRHSYEVISETVGQCTGLQDKNGKPIFEGDIVDVMYDPHYIGIAIQRIGVFKVMFHEGCFMKRNETGFFHFIPSDECKIVGNVFDNPDLTEVEK